MQSLGWSPLSNVYVNIGRDTDFVQTITRRDGTPWPAGAQIVLLIGDDAVWPAATAGAVATWNVDKMVVGALCDQLFGTQTDAKVTYSDATGLDLTLMTGKVAWFR